MSKDGLIDTAISEAAESIGDAIVDSLQSVNKKNDLMVNVVDVIDGVAQSIMSLRRSITDSVAGWKDSAGGHVECLTEAVMGITSGLCKIADSISDLADAIRERTPII